MNRAAASGDPAGFVEVIGNALYPDLSGTAWWAAERTLIVADLHLEKGSAGAERGRLLPPYDTAATLSRLAAAIGRFNPRRIIALGDSFHDRGAGNRMHRRDLDMLAAMQSGREWIWITGNHDPEIPLSAGGDVAMEASIGSLLFRHEPAAGTSQGEIAGHLHPCARIASGGRTHRRRCFVGDGTRLVLPAFGAFTGGLNVLDRAFAPLFAAALSVHAIGDKGVYRFSRRRLVPD